MEQRPGASQDKHKRLSEISACAETRVQGKVLGRLIKALLRLYQGLQRARIKALLRLYEGLQRARIKALLRLYEGLQRARIKALLRL